MNFIYKNLLCLLFLMGLFLLPKLNAQTDCQNDLTAPLIEYVPADVIVECDAIPPAGTLTVSDNCDPNPVISGPVETSSGSNCDIVRTWTVTDESGNFASVSQIITIEDTIVPVFSNIPLDMTVECGAIPEFEAPTASDNCDPNPEISAYVESSNGSDCSIVRTWTVMDHCGNSATASQLITFTDEDTQAPELIDAPSDITLGCGEDLPASGITVIDNCIALSSLNEEITESGEGCARGLIRTWTATDACGNTATASQLITFIDTESPQLINVPADITIACDGEIPTNDATAVDNCDVAPDLSEEISPIIEGCPGVLARTWIATDDCGNFAISTQTITIIEEEMPPTDDTWPGDTNTDAVVDHFDLLNIGLGYNSTGVPRANPSLNWIAQTATDWGSSSPLDNVDYKHADTDGNGNVNSEDIPTIILNWTQSHNFNDDNEEDRTEGVPFYLEEELYEEGQTYSLPIILGEPDMIAEQAYGIAFSLTFDNEIIEENTIGVDFSNSWLGNIDDDIYDVQKAFHEEGRIDVAVTRIDGQNIDGYGIFGHLDFIIVDDVLLHDENEEDRTLIVPDFNISNAQLINAEGQIIDVSTDEGTTTSTSSVIDAIEVVHIYPNPAQQVLNIHSANTKMKEIELYTATGQQLKRESLKNQNGIHQIDITTLPKGVYFLKILVANGDVLTKKVLVID